MAAARTIRQATAGAGLVALAAPEDDGSVIACAEAGVAAFVARDATLDELVAATRAVARGELPAHSPRIAAALLRRVADGARPPEHAVLAPLTSRERQIVALIDEGLSNKEIAARLCIELSTVKNHVHNLLEKLGARGRAEAARACVRRGRAERRCDSRGARERRPMPRPVTRPSPCAGAGGAAAASGRSPRGGWRRGASCRRRR